MSTALMDKPDLMIERPDGAVEVIEFETPEEAEAAFARLKLQAQAGDATIVSLSWSPNEEIVS